MVIGLQWYYRVCSGHDAPEVALLFWLFAQHMYYAHACTCMSINAFGRLSGSQQADCPARGGFAPCINVAHASWVQQYSLRVQVVPDWIDHNHDS